MPIRETYGRTRRSFLAAAGGGATAAVAGCLGDIEGALEDETQNLRMRTAAAETAAYGANEGIASVVNDQTDEIYVEANTSSGTEANVGALDDESAEMVYIQNWSAREVAEGVEPFDDLSFEMAQAFHFYDLPWFFCSADEDLETLSDIESGTAISPTPEGSGTAPALEHALERAGDYDRVSYSYGEQGSAMNEGQLDVGVGTYMNFQIAPGWLQEMMGTVDLRVLGVDDELLEDWRDDDKLLIESFDGDELEEASTPEEVHCPTFAYNFVCRDDLDYDAVYTFLETMYDHREQLDEYSAMLGRLGDDEFWVRNAYEGLPFHDAAADFYEEIGIWSDEFERVGDA
ncbi:TAXI family TRAP transporter solute-binding subunit [Natronococcus wangiae]|uniref:TAXI family TRAP transporter solute-binding subunit n=1 Tax=Natronococcus wangiae TaxID=3068275 RepID=UPI00273F778E|nr:TAXI family TRAP transporter solute-binding subunit [Natronococcus sp. AD5]